MAYKRHTEGGKVEAHPAANLFPMMSEPELQELAADIKENGLRNPITLTGDSLILDGRNRAAACELAEVTPDYVNVNGVDPLAFVISQNVKRRNLSVAQKAMAAAEAYGMMGEQPESGRGESWYDVYSKLFSVGRDSIQKARALLERDPIAAASVKNGETTLTEAYEALRSRERESEAVSTSIKRLKAERGDLAELVEQGKLDRAEAMLIVEREEREEEEAKRRIYGYFREALGHLAWDGTEANGRDHAANLAAYLQGTELDAARFRSAAWLASTIADAMEGVK